MENNKVIVSSFFWKASEKAIVQLTRLVLDVILARLLLPDDYGVYTLLLSFVAISNILIEGGLGSALIQKKQIDEEDSSTVFLILMFFSIAIYLLLFFTAPLIANYYEIPGFERYLRVLALAIFPSSYNSVQNSIAMREYKFKKIFAVNSVTIIISGIIAIILAYLKFNVWALIVQHSIQIFLSCLLMNYLLRWKPSFHFSKERGKALFSFGWKLMISNLLNRGYGEVYNIVIGKAFNTTTLGFYNKAKMLPGALENGLTSVVTTVMFPFFSRNQDKKEEVKRTCRLALSSITFFIAPIFCGIAATSEPIIIVLLTPKWVEVAPIMEVLCFGFIFQPISHINTVAINGIGRSDVVLRLEIIKRTIGILSLFIAIKMGIVQVAYALTFSYLVNMFLNCYANQKLINISIGELLKDIMPSILISVIMYLCVKSFYRLGLFSNVYLMLCIQIFAGFVIYFSLSWFFNKKIFLYLINKAKLFLKMKKA